MTSYHSTGNAEPYCILFTLNEKYNAHIILLYSRIVFKAKCERREMSSTNFKLRLLKVTFLTYMLIYIEISILQVINFTSSDLFELRKICHHTMVDTKIYIYAFCVPDLFELMVLIKVI